MNKFMKKTSEIKILAPITGLLMDVSEVPDEVFSEKMIGDGIAIDPIDGLVTAPVNGRITQIFSTNHALTIESKEGLEVLIHLGLNTVELNGEGFVRLAEPDAVVKQGEPIMQMDIEKIKSMDRSPITPVIVLNPETIGGIEKSDDVVVEAAVSKVMTVRMKKR